MNGDLNQLHDIITPDPVSFWPLAEGWYALLILILSVLIPWLISRIKRQRINAYRQQALVELNAITNIGLPNEKLIQLFDLLKRTAMTAYPRTQIASLSGDAWWSFLNQTSQVKFTHASQENIQQVLYNPKFKLAIDDCKQFEKAVRKWIKIHRSLENV